MGWTEIYKKGGGPIFYQYLFNLGLCISQGISTILGGDPDESLCSRCAKASRSGNKVFSVYIVPFIDLCLGESDHCLRAIEDDEGIKQVWNWEKESYK